jgi:hypothetical protein
MARARDASGDVQPLVAEWNPSGYLWNAAHQVGVSVSTSVHRAAPTQLSKPDAPAPQVVKTACLPCHGTDIMEQQRLTPAQWEREIDKMIRWGAPVKPEDRPAILKYLLEISGQ